MSQAGPPTVDPERRAFREFVRTHHPDRGGDPEIFRAGLEAFRRSRPLAEDDPRLRVDLRFHRRRRGPVALLELARRRLRERGRPPRVR